jgi:hypothetical protein
MRPPSRRVPFAAILVLVFAVLPIAYVAAYLQLSEAAYWEVCGGGGKLHVRSFPSRRMARFFEPLAQLESRLVEQTALASKKAR